MSALLDLLDKLSFESHVAQNLSLANFLSAQRLCGIYVLHFRNDEIYVGQAINVIQRYGQHCKTYDDITQISFKTVDVSELNKTEKGLIQKLEKMGFHLRNKVHTSATFAPSPFDEILAPEAQERWLQELHFCPNNSPRVPNDEMRKKYTSNFQKFMTHPFAEESLHFLKAYVRACIPQPNASEAYYWSCTCLPYKGGLLYRVNIYQQEVLYVASKGGQVQIVWRLAKSPIFRRIFNNIWLTRLLLKYELNWIDWGYSAGGTDQFTLVANDFKNAMAVLTDARFVSAMRTFNLRLMRKGTNLNYRSHSYDLADRVLE